MGKSKRIANIKDTVPVVSVADGENEAAKHPVLSVVLPWPYLESTTSQVPEEASHSLVETTWSEVPQGQRSKRRSTHKQLRVVQDTGIDRGTSGECPNESSVVARKPRKSKRKADKGDSEVSIPRRPHSRGQARKGLSCNNTEISDPEMLNSKTFECYLENLWREFPEDKRSSFTYFDCLWFSLYSKEHYKEKVLNWIKKKNIFSKKYVFVPIVQWSHWSLLILCHFGETRTRCMLLLDSLQTTNPKRLEPGIRRFISDIYTREERSEEEQEQLKKIPLLVPKVPQQRNNKECGHFVLYYIKLFLESAPENFSIPEGYPYFMKEDWFTSKGLKSFYQGLDSIRMSVDASDEEEEEEEEEDDDIDIRSS